MIKFWNRVSIRWIHINIFRLDLVAERSVAEEKPQCLCHHLVWGTDMAQSLCHYYGETIHWRKQRPPSCGLCQGPQAACFLPFAENSTFHKIMTKISQLSIFLLVFQLHGCLHWSPPFPDTPINTILLRISHCFHTIADEIRINPLWHGWS